MNTRKDITLYFDQGDNCWAFKPHSGKADAFLAAEFKRIGDRDLTSDDIIEISTNAGKAGLSLHTTQ